MAGKLLRARRAAVTLPGAPPPSGFDYPAHLAAAWAEHLAPHDPNAPTVVSTFAGAGGSSLGYSMAGFRELLAVEWDDNAVQCFRANFPGIPVYHGDIKQLTVEEVLRLTGLRVGELDLFDGSPPCQGFSTAGKRDFDDPRNQLFRQYVRLLQGLQPRVFVMENVSGMVKGKMKLIFADVLTELRGCGYRVEARVLNAACFGVPQARMRMIFVGVREDLGLDPSHPTAQTAPIALRDALPELAGIRTKNDKFKNKVFPASGPSPTLVASDSQEYAGVVLASRSQRINPWMPAAGPAATLCKNGQGYEILVSLGVDGLPVTHPDPPRLTPKYQRLAPMIVPGGRHAGSQSCARADAARPAHTLNRSNTGTGFGTPLHPYEHRSLSIPEAKRIGSFPDGFRLVGSFAQQWARIGNSVPPLLARAIGRHLREHILRR